MVGISADKSASQLKFIEKYALTYPMVPDPNKLVINAYGVHMVLGLAAQRVTFLIGPDGHIAHVWPNVKLQGHVEDVIATIKGLTPAG